MMKNKRFSRNVWPLRSRFSQFGVSGWYKIKTITGLFPQFNITPANIILTIRDGTHGREGALMRWAHPPLKDHLNYQ